MAKENVTQGGDVPQIAPPDPLKVLNWIDSCVQGSTHSILALVTAAKGMLALDASALMTVSDLLDQIADKANDIQNSVNFDAESCGVNHRDDTEERAVLRKRLFAQHHALHKASGVTA